MRFLSWLRFATSLSQRTHSKSRRRPRRQRAVLRLEQLETRITPTFSLSTLASFNGSNGASPYASLVMDSSGNLYGTTSSGGASGDGTVFELTHGSGTPTTLASFNGTNGSDPVAGLIPDSSGNLYGAAEQGGTSKAGTLFELAQGSGTITTLASFSAPDVAPLCLSRDNSGNLYGVTNGLDVPFETVGETVFELPEGSSAVTTLASFPSGTYAYGYGGLVMDSSGNLYGTSYYGGSSNEGAVYEVAQGSGTVTTLASFSGSNGSDPLAGLIMDSSGNLYGTTKTGGASGDGTVFELSTCPSFAVSGFPSPTTAGLASTFTVTALNADGTVNTGYTGTVHFSSSDPQAVLPADYTFTATDQGAHAFSATLKTAGTQSVAATDTANSSVVGNDAGITVTPAAASALVFSNVPSSSAAGSAFTLALTVEDAYGNTATGYTGTVHFSSSDARAVLPANYTFTSGDAGKHTFSVTLKTAGTQSVTATNTATGSITGSVSGIVVHPAAASKFVLGAPSGVSHGVPFSVTLTVEDGYGNVVTGYTGTVHFSSSDGTASLPANYTFTAGDAGVHTFTGLVLRKKGKQTLTVTDMQNSALTASESINVS
jgi:uncharacterized repeat protein (TIGR03803 family)